MPTPGTYATASDATLVLLARERDQQAFAALVERHQQWLRRLLRRLSHDPDLADDLAQQVLLRAWEALPGLQAGQALPAWLKVIAVRTWLKHLRRRDPSCRLDRGEPVPDAAVTGAAAMNIDLNRALAKLTGEVRLCVVLSYHEGMSHAAIAELTGLPLGTVKSHINRGSAQLRAYLAGYAIERSAS
ncbi:MAG: sigma-70 family RNA polymerase sigma factor [Gammaproteobacteria bacterium]|nr:sigma-70 family RNA polymerase sigma factor [Gammaproteobacteria bacterium]